MQISKQQIDSITPYIYAAFKIFHISNLNIHLVGKHIDGLGDKGVPLYNL